MSKFTVLSNGYALNDTIQFSRAQMRNEMESFLNPLESSIWKKGLRYFL